MEYGLIGEKLTHSFSKEIHKRLFSYDYTLKELKKEELKNFFAERKFKAINVTIPYKTDIMPFLDFIEDSARDIGAVNTVVNSGGKLYGYNTDFYGLKSLIEREKIEIKDKKVLILGNGGTSKTAYSVAKSLGAKRILKVSRRSENGCIPYEEAKNNHADTDVIINTTPCGMYPNVCEMPICIDGFKNLSGVVDVIYNPLCTRLVLSARERGIKAVGGFYMLVTQASFAAEKFTGVTVKKDKNDAVYNELLAEKRNIVLIGMPSSGKSTVGKIAAENLSKTFIDTDELIKEKADLTPAEIIEKYGEAEFRKIESEVIKEISVKQNCVIATGGGAVLKKENVDFLKMNGKIFFLDRNLNELTGTPDRPLSSTKEKIEKLYNERYGIYLRSADVVIKSGETAEKTAKEVEKG